MKTRITFDLEDWCKLCDALECTPDTWINILIITAINANKRSRHTLKLLCVAQEIIEIWDNYGGGDSVWIENNLDDPIDKLRDIIGKTEE